jgi:hypothetical protein
MYLLGEDPRKVIGIVATRSWFDLPSKGVSAHGTLTMASAAKGER